MTKYYSYNRRQVSWTKTIAIAVLLAWTISGHGLYYLYGQVTADAVNTANTVNAAKDDNDDLLIAAVKNKNWDQLPPLFKDDSYKTLITYFGDARAISITPSQPNHLSYKAKFELQAEMGSITFQKNEGRYLELEIKNQIKPIYFTENFKIYKADNNQITLGDAQIDFVSGLFYESMPNSLLLVFKGKWNISITPNDEEEKLTLRRLFKKDSFEKEGETGVFILEKKEFLHSLPLLGETAAIDPDAQIIFDTFRELYGINIEEFNEYWYLPFPESSNVALFEKDKKSHYFYFHDESQVPDTQLTESDTEKILLNYNSFKEMKLSFGGGGSGVSRMNLNVSINPRENYISGTNIITYKSVSNARELRLAEGLDVVSYLTFGSKDLNVFRKKEKYYFMGEGVDTLFINYKGRIKSSIETLELFKSAHDPNREGPGPDPSSFYYLSWTKNFYPNTGEEFCESSVTVNVPTGINCLATGNSMEKKEITGDTNTFKFTCPSSKGVSIVTGNFNLTQKQNSRIPLHFYTYDTFRYPKDLDLTEVKNAFDFFLQRFCSLDLSSVNILLRRGKVEGGVSNTGFVVVILPYERTTVSSPSPMALEKFTTEKKILSPILIRDRTEDHIIHELAHQWWGGIISWKSYQDVWLTEGLAHFSVLYYLKSKLSPRDFHGIVRDLKRWTFRNSDSGPIIYGPRINLLENKYEVYQSVIYNKSALVLLMLMDLIGEKEFEERLQTVVKKYKYQSLSSMQFIREFSGKNKMIFDFFRQWIYSRLIPQVELTLVEDDKEMDKKEFKKVVIQVTQLNTDFIFPLKLRVATSKGVSTESVIMKAKEQKFVIKRDATIKTIEVADSDYLVREKKQPPSYAPGKQN
ncbi:MAG: Peptidase protein [Acidobacteriota bacterium]|nr:Peptidase protein [Acidobacteriota bacterium]